MIAGGLSLSVLLCEQCWCSALHHFGGSGRDAMHLVDLELCESVLVFVYYACVFALPSFVLGRILYWGG